MAIGTSRANRDPAALKRLFLPHLERIDPGFGIETMVLAAALVQAASDLQMVLSETHAEPAPPRAPLSPLDLLPPLATQPAPPRATPPAGRRLLPAERGEAGLLVADLVDQLANDREPARLYRPARRESHLPERPSRARRRSPSRAALGQGAAAPGPAARAPRAGRCRSGEPDRAAGAVLLARAAASPRAASRGRSASRPNGGCQAAVVPAPARVPATISASRTWRGGASGFTANRPICARRAP